MLWNIYIYIYTKWYYENSEWLNIKITVKISHRTHSRDIWSSLACTLMANPTTVNRDHYCPLSLPHITEMYVLNRNDAILMKHYSDIIMSTIASQITSRTIAYPTIFQAQIIENIKALCHWPGDQWPQRASNVDNVSIWWRHHDFRHWQYRVIAILLTFGWANDENFLTKSFKQFCLGMNMMNMLIHWGRLTHGSISKPDYH